MNSIESIHFRNFVPPKLESLLSFKSIAFLGINIATLGVHGAAEALSKTRRIRELKFNQGELHNQIASLLKDWEALETEINEVLLELRGNDDFDDEEKFQDIKQHIQQLSEKRDNLCAKRLANEEEISASISELALGALAFVGQLFANVVTIGLYGVYQNYSLLNRVKILEAQNDHIRNQANQFFMNKAEKMKNSLAFIDDDLELKNEIKETDTGKAILRANRATKDLEDIQKRHEDIRLKLDVLKAEHAKLVIEKSEKDTEYEQLIEENEQLDRKVTELKQESQKWKIDYQRKDKQFDDFRIQKNKEAKDLRDQFVQANLKALRVAQLEREVERLQNFQKNQPQIQKLQSQVGPIAPKYNRREEDDDIEGAAGIDDISGQNEETYSDYAKRYNNKRTAEEVLKASFDYCFKELLKLSGKLETEQLEDEIPENELVENELIEGEKQEGVKKITPEMRFNDCPTMQSAAGARALYRFMAIDLLKGAKLQYNCHGFFELLLNNQGVKMRPSYPEKFLREKWDSGEKKLKPCVEIRFAHHDDFTPTEDMEDVDRMLPLGVDGASAKWILNQLSEEEYQHLFHLLMSPLIPNEDPLYSATKEFMKNEQDKRVQLINTAYSLICDIGIAFQMKFGQNILIECWQNHVDTTNFEIAFEKPEDKEIDTSKIKDNHLVQVSNSSKIVDWELDPDVLGDKRSGDRRPRQPEFNDLIGFSQIKYRILYEHLSRDLLGTTEKDGKEFVNLTWSPINEQFHVSHEMIGGNSIWGGNEGQRCLLSNLLAILVTNQKELTENNVLQLRNAMAAYLDKLRNANNDWESKNFQNKDPKKLEEQSVLYKSFQAAIRNSHKCSIGEYQAWLRGHIFGAANINISNLTALEIQLCAFTIGVRICLLPINVGSRAKVDEWGRIIPEGEIYGPNTKELLFMGNSNGTFYGLFSKINLNAINEEELEYEEYDAISEIEDYWKQITINKT